MATTLLDVLGAGAEFLTLAESLDENDPRWMQCAASSLVFGYAKAVLGGIPVAASVKQRIERWARRVTDLDECRPLHAVLDAETPDQVALAVLEWSRRIEARGALTIAKELAASVLRIDVARADALRQVARCHRALGEFDDAYVTYATLRSWARERHDRTWELRAALWSAETMMEWGHIDVGADEFERVIDEADGLAVVLAPAWITVGYLALARDGDGARSKAATIAAFEWITRLDEHEQARLADRATLNLAFAERELGHPADAIDLAERLARNIHADEEPRVRAICLLMILAAETRNKRMLENQRRRLLRLEVTPAARWATHAADGIVASYRGDFEGARDALERARSVALALHQAREAKWSTRAIAAVDEGRPPALFFYEPLLVERIGWRAESAARHDSAVGAAVVANGR